MKKKIRGVFEKVAGSGVWWVQYYAEGKRRREKVGRKSDAITLYQKRKADDRAGVKLPENIRFQGERLAAVIDRGIKWYQQHGKPRSAVTAIARLKVARESLGHKLVDDLTPADIEGWLASHKAWTPATRNRYKCCLSRALQLAVINGHAKRNVARLVALKREDNTRVRWLKDDEVKRLYEEGIMSPGLRDMVDFARHVGARKGEQFALTWPMVDFERRVVKFTKTKTYSDREVPMNETVFRLMTRLQETRTGSNNRVFQSMRYDAPIDNPRKAFETSLRKAKIRDFRWHDLRHDFCSRLVMAGVPLITVSKLAGHKSISVTMRYAHLSPQHLAGAVEVLDGGYCSDPMRQSVSVHREE